ncbi:putative pentatricopeptide repeat-containing protein [Prunus yedoensis var. nudiflora]|uniref:Putative pentatricopeptide repeat-containing protein n=1 Tax=Prunus yedoensis var. nudiflora TaxID=2094558 RepID=A0A314Z2N5_PRUYE|nr:putative pentatricopeptide repeat-containing protein [Prunus yedoensis var. nudiflora]
MQLLPWPSRLRSLLLSCKDKASTDKIHALMILTGTITHGNSYARLIATYARIGDIVSARKVFDNLSQRGIHAWNAIIIAYSRQYCPSEVCGKMDEAVVVFNKMPRRDLVCWTTMVTGFVQSGRPIEAVDMYKTMQNEGMEFDGVVLMGLVQACASLGDLRLGLSVHGFMIRTGLPMDVMVQTSLVHMYAKNGHLELASSVFNKMPYKNAISWGALISGFAQNGFAGHALEMLVEMQGSGFEPDSVSLVATSIGSCRSESHSKEDPREVDDVAGMKKMMKQTGTKKVPGYSVVEVNGELHAFLMEDKTHQHHEDIMLLLNKLDQDMRAVGYIPRTEFMLHNFEEEHSSEQR